MKTLAVLLHNSLIRAAIKAAVYCSIILLAMHACAPWWPERSTPYAASTRIEAVVCVETAIRDQRFRTGERWELFQHNDEKFTRWRYRYSDRQRSSPTYLATYDEVTVDALASGQLRITVLAWHRYGNPWKGFHNEDKAPGPAAYRLVTNIENKCAVKSPA